MSTFALADSPDSEDAFRHEAFLYAGEAQFVEGAAAFIGEAIVEDEPVLVVVSSRKIDLLRKRLGPVTDDVRFADMDEVGVNPARIIPAWADFVNDHGERRTRGVGEPIWAERSREEIVECQLHEALLNLAFAGSNGFTLLCPYDTAALGQDVVDEAVRSHRFILRDGAHWDSPRWPGIEEMGGPLSASLPEIPHPALELVFEAGSLGDLRSQVSREASRAGFGPSRAADVVTAVNEVASNSLRHGGGGGELRLWHGPDAVVCEVTDGGHIVEPLVGRVRPETDDRGGRGLWIVNQLCELVQIRSTLSGTAVRMHFRRRRAR